MWYLHSTATLAEVKPESDESDDDDDDEARAKLQVGITMHHLAWHKLKSPSVGTTGGHTSEAVNAQEERWQAS